MFKFISYCLDLNICCSHFLLVKRDALLVYGSKTLVLDFSNVNKMSKRILKLDVTTKKLVPSKSKSSVAFSIKCSL